MGPFLTQGGRYASLPIICRPLLHGGTRRVRKRRTAPTLNPAAGSTVWQNANVAVTYNVASTDGVSEVRIIVPGAADKVAAIGKAIAATPVAGYVGCSHAIPKINLTARLKEIRDTMEGWLRSEGVQA